MNMKCAIFFSAVWICSLLLNKVVETKKLSIDSIRNYEEDFEFFSEVSLFTICKMLKIINFKRFC